MSNISVSAQIFIWITTTYGISVVVSQSKIFEPIRSFMYKRISTFLGDMLKCIMCFGFWVGLVMSLVLQLGPNNLHTNRLYRIVLDGFATSGIVWIIHVVLFRLRDENCEK